MVLVKRVSVLAIMMFVLLTGLFACDADFTTLPSQNEVASVSVIESSVQNAYVIDTFDVSNILLEVEEAGGDVRTVSLESSHLDEDTQTLLTQTGLHTLNGEYQDQTFSFDLRLVESSRDLMLYTLYTLGVEDASLEEDYETWLDSIQGVSVENAEVDDAGMLVVMLNDGSTIEAGYVKGEDGVDGQGIESVHQNADDHLVFTYDDGSEDTIELNEDPYMVRFMTETGYLIDIQHVSEGGSFSFPNAPEREGESFTEWTETNPDNVTSDQVIYAQYEPNTYELTFETGTNDAIIESYEYDSPIDFPSLEKENHDFIGWYLDEARTTLFAKETMPAGNTTLYARWLESTEGETADTTESSAADMVERVRGAMVSVINIQTDGGGTGSGVVYKDDLEGNYYLFTNHHVIEDHESLEIHYEYYRNEYVVRGNDVEFIGSYEKADIAVIKFTPYHAVDTVDFADSYALRAGNTVYAYGSPQGTQYSGTLTTGVISETHRNVALNDTEAVFIQHDAAISPGSSGGALLDTNGDIIGMNTLKAVGDDVEGIGFALPSNTIERMVGELEDDGAVTASDFGVTTGIVTDCEGDFGACIDSVTLNGTADVLGLQSGDNIIGFKQSGMDDYYTIYNAEYLTQAVMDTRTGTEVSVRYERDGTTYESSTEPMQ